MTVLEWLHRLTAYGWVDLGGHLIAIALLTALICDVERLYKVVNELRDQLHRPTEPEPATVPIPAAVKARHRAVKGARRDTVVFGDLYADADD